jgi:acetyl esterase/lipase
MGPSLRRTVLAFVVAAVAAASVLPSYAGHDNGKGKSRDKRPAPVSACTGDPAAVQRMSLTVEGQEAPALVGLPRKKPRGIVVFDHGYGHTMESWREHVARTAENLGVIAVAPNYRGQEVPPLGQKTSSRGWRVAEGAADSIAFAQHFERLCKPGGTNVVYGVSMGGNTSGLVVAAQPKRANGAPLFDYWVAVEPAVNVSQTYLGASALAPANAFAANAKADIEEAFGGPLTAKPDVYAERTVVNRTDDIAGAGLKGVYVVQGLADGLVTSNQSRELQSLLRARGVPLDMWTAVTRKAGTEPGTTVDGYLPSGQTSPFAGHASETSTTHVVAVAGFAALDGIYAGGPFTCGEAVYDGTADRAVRASSTGC